MLASTVILTPCVQRVGLSFDIAHNLHGVNSISNVYVSLSPCRDKAKLTAS